ncbi:putative L-type lectin-domain containing receptor kinase VI.1 [Morus notabilis]|uniref:non-specific serine/threonine protein kinase n=1 Tax=Morus notabilis TaxID=981085 RepID=W9QU65_9ROSA|nr:probable L-type lectin-domain containing receptor kinase VI.1 [Morus notabilis]EXB54262.1 putative L-type lectin-domain containing receptor kinase VI.1 [Morus notabilis]
MALAISFSFLLVFLSPISSSHPQNLQFIFEGFNRKEANLTTKGASIISSGLLRITNLSENVIGQTFYRKPIKMLTPNSNTSSSSSSGPTASSFSTHFVFAIVSPTPGRGGFGIAFTISPSTNFPKAEAGHYLGLFYSGNDGNRLNHIFAVEFDTVNGLNENSDSKGNHVGININSMVSNASKPAGYVKEGSVSNEEDLDLESGDLIQAWVDYDGKNKIINVTVAPIRVEKRPSTPLLSIGYDLSDVLLENMFVGFSSSTGKKSSYHYLSGWSFSINGPAPPLNLSKLPAPPKQENSSSFKLSTKVLIASLSVIIVSLFVILFCLTLYKRIMPFERLEDWELDCPHRFCYKDLYTATKGFKDTEVIGVGGFGAVYKGVSPSTGCEVAVKKITRSCQEGMKEFAAEIESLGRLRHKNLVNLQGWCKKKNHLLIVYDYIPYGSLDSLIFHPKNDFVLGWEQRFNILRGVASGLLYLHEEWEQVVLHRDVKSSNVLIDSDMNARLGDFGLARLHDHGEMSHTTGVVGTIGYIAPELARIGKASTSTDVFAYGALLLEVATGRRPIGPEHFVLVDWVMECYHLGRLMSAVDLNLGLGFVVEEMELVLKLGLLCSHYKPEARPSMRQVIRHLNGEEEIPEIDHWGLFDSQSVNHFHSRFMQGLSSDKITSYRSSSLGAISYASLDAGR